MQWITTTQIIEDLKNPDDSRAWNSFRDHFYPVIYSFAKKMGLSSTNAEDAAQEVMLTFLKTYKNKYSRQKGRLSSWIFGIAKRVILDYRKKLPKDIFIQKNATATSFWNTIPDESSLRQTWDGEWKKMVLEKCLLQVRREVDPTTFQAFELYALQQYPIDQVSKQLNMTPNAIYLAKSRILTKVRQLQHRFDPFD